MTAPDLQPAREAPVLLTLDPGLTATGYAIFRFPNPTQVTHSWEYFGSLYQASGTYYVPAGQLAGRLASLAAWTRELAHQYDPLMAFCEKPATARIYWGRKPRDQSGEGALNAADLALHHMARGAILSALGHTCPVEEVTPGKFRKSARHQLLPHIIKDLRKSSSHQRDAISLALVILTDSRRSWRVKKA